MIMSEQNGTEPVTYTWRSRTRARTADRVVHELLRRDVPEVEVATLCATLTGIRGAHQVVIRQSGHDSLYRAVWFRGTARAMTRATGVIKTSGVHEPDRNADHDHAACLANAAKQGVPAAWAHTPETYLSM
jgi:hypothetical protein